MFVSVCDRDKRAIVPIARDIVRLGFHVVATAGTARALRAAGVECEEVKKIHEGAPNVCDMIAGGEIALMVNTPFGHATRADGYELRLEAVKHGVTHVTNLAGCPGHGGRHGSGPRQRPDRGGPAGPPAMGAGGGTGVSASRKGGAQGRSVLRASLRFSWDSRGNGLAYLVNATRPHS